MKHSAEMLRCIVQLDVPAARKLWAAIFPNMPQPASDVEALVMLHFARTSSISAPFRDRAYSHRWLVDNGWPSGLPDNLKSRAERIYPKIVDAVGISVNMKSALLRPIAPIVHRAMSDAVLEAYAEKKTEPLYLRQRIQEVRHQTIHKLLGKIRSDE